MKTAAIFFSLVVLLLMAVPVAADASITSFSPTTCYQGTATTFTITGSGFNTSSVSVLLMKSGVDNVTASTISNVSSTEIICTFSSAKLSDMTAGSWYFVVVSPNNPDVKATTALTLKAPMTLTSITPSTGRSNNASVAVSVVGTGLTDVTSMYLYKSGSSNISASGVDPISSVKTAGTFNLNGQTEDTYSVCVRDSAGTRVCGLSFKITAGSVGRLDISSNPSGAVLYIDGSNKGTTPVTLDDLDVGTYKLILKKDGYMDWTRTAIITNGTTTSYSANLEVKTTAPTTTATTAPTTEPTTVKITRKSTVTTPTPWPSDTPTQASPIGMIAIVGGIGLGLLAVRRR